MIRVRNALIALVCFGACSGALRLAIPWPASYGLRAKVEHYRRHADRYDTLHFGSSLTFRAVVPEILDRALAQRGVPRSSYNFAVAGMHAFEMHYLLEEVLRDAPDNLRHVFIEHIQWQPKAQEEGITDRSVYWHSLPTTLALLHSLVARRGPIMERLDLAWLHTKLMARRYTNYAQGRLLLEPWIDRDPTFDYITPDEVDGQRGYQDPETLLVTANIDSPRARQRRREFLEGVDAYAGQVLGISAYHRQRSAGPADAAALDRYPVSSVRRHIESIAAPGRELVFVLPPSRARVDEAIALAEAGVYPALIEMCDPNRFPELYQANSRFDFAHLNQQGARVYSVLLADEYVRLRAEHPAD